MHIFCFYFVSCCVNALERYYHFLVVEQGTNGKYTNKNVCLLRQIYNVSISLPCNIALGPDSVVTYALSNTGILVLYTSNYDEKTLIPL